MTPLLLTLFKWSETIGFISMVIFVVQYSFLAKWWKNMLGLTIVLECIAIILILLPSMAHFYLNLTTSNSVGFAWYTLVSFTMVPLIMVTRIATFESYRQRIRKVERSINEPEPPDISGGDVSASPSTGQS